MPEPQQQSDPVDKFLALPRDQQEKAYRGLSDPAKNKLFASIKERKQKKNVPKVEQPGYFKRLGQSVGLPTSKEELGQAVKEEFSPKGLVEKAVPGVQAVKSTAGYLKDVYHSGKETPKEVWEAGENIGKGGPIGANLGKAAYAEIAGATSAIPFIGKPTVTAGQDIAAENYRGAAGGLTGVIAQVLLPEALEKGGTALKSIKEGSIPRSMTKPATKMIIQKHLFDRAQGVQQHIQAAADSARAEDALHWKHLEETIDGKRPQGSIDVGNLRAEAQSAVEGAIKTPQKLPATVETIRKGSEPPKVFGDRLNLSNPAHKALYDTLKEQGAIPEDRDVITFAEAKQIRSKLGKELHGGTALSGEAKAVGWKVYNGLTDAMSKAAAQENLSGAFADANKLHSEYMDTFVDRKAPLAKALRGENPHEIVGPLSDAKHAEQARRAMKKYQRHGIDSKQIDREGVIFQKLKSGLPYQYPSRSWEIASDVIGAGSLAASALTGEASLAAGGAGLLTTPARLGVNWARRAGALREVESPQAFEETRQPPRVPMRGEEPLENQMREGTPSWLSKLRPEEGRPAAPHSNTAAGAARHAQAVKMAWENLGKGASVKEILAEADRIERGMR